MSHAQFAMNKGNEQTASFAWYHTGLQAGEHMLGIALQQRINGATPEVIIQRRVGIHIIYSIRHCCTRCEKN